MSAGIGDSVPLSPSLANGVEQDKDVLCLYFRHSIFQNDAGQTFLPSCPQNCLDLQSHEYIVKLVLQDLGKSSLLVRDIPKPPSFWEVQKELPA